MEPGTFTRVLHDFFTTESGELSLHKGEYFIVDSVIDKYWCYGRSNYKFGKFPSNSLHKVELPSIKDSEVIFVSVAPFSGEEPGDLSFDDGEIIIGTEAGKIGWYKGYIGSREGIFPKTHTWQIDRRYTEKSCSNKNLKKKARVIANLEAQLDEELDLREGEIVHVTEIRHDGWCFGFAEDGRKGIFPEGFLSYIDEDSSDQVDTTCILGNNMSCVLPEISTNYQSDKDEIYTEPEYKEIDDPAPSYYNLFPEAKNADECNKEIDQCDLEPYAITLHPFSGQFSNELSFNQGETVHLVKHIDTDWMEGYTESARGIFPKSYVNIIVDCSCSKSENVTYDQENSHDATTLKPGATARIEYTFKAQMDGDISVNEGDIVTVLNMANEDWVNVKTQNGLVGLCPRSYLNQIGDSPNDSIPSCNEIDQELEDFVVLRHEKSNETDSTELASKRLSEPHRPAPPVPVPGRLPLKQNEIETNVLSREKDENADLNAERNVSREKRADQRQNVISELVITEKEYVRDLKVTYEIFTLYDPSILESKGINVPVLFGNILEVIHVAEELLELLLLAMKGRKESVQKVGPCFLQIAEKMQTVYAKYCNNHDDALALLKKYEDNSEIMQIFNQGIATLRRKITCFDMSSILIKPVQRILKYPLILNELVKSTEEDHPDRGATIEAWATMTNVATYINEKKRSKDIVFKYLDGEKTLMRKMANLNMHSVAKMSTRWSKKVAVSFGLSNVQEDERFTELERQFKFIEKCTLHFVKDLEEFKVHLIDEANMGEVLADFLIHYYSGTPNNEIKNLREIRSVIWTQYIGDFTSTVERNVIKPLLYLATILDGPAILITKRYDKLLDYDAAVSKSEKYKDNRIIQEELSTAKNNYEALNEQLKEELPTLIDASTNILTTCIFALINARKLLAGRITECYLSLCENNLRQSPKQVIDSFLVNHNLLWNKISCLTFADDTIPKLDEPSKPIVQFDTQRSKLKNKYAHHNLYVISENITCTLPYEISAVKGTLVAVIKKQDPMGDSSRWYVDDGERKGFVPFQKLIPFQQIQSANTKNTNYNENSSVDNRYDTPDLICMDSPEKEKPHKPESNLEDLLSLNLDIIHPKTQNYANINNTASVSQVSEIDKFYYAAYDFNENIPKTLSIKKGQALKLIKAHDEEGSKEWWLVEDRYGRRGYVPSNRLETPAEANLRHH